jgi:D-arabinose 1-dehydrogenase-like Zn-dependent alcohol dehydrogenase
VNNDWKGGVYPMVPGHEVVGVVEAIGGEVAAAGRFKIGDRVGVGSSTVFVLQLFCNISTLTSVLSSRCRSFREQ